MKKSIANFGLMAMVGAATLSAPALAKDLLMGATSASSSHYGYFVAVGNVINENAKGLKATVVETGATMDNIRRMQRKQLDIGLITTNTVKHAVDGTQSFKGNAQDLKMLWIYMNVAQNVVVRADSGVKSLNDLSKVKFNPGGKGSSSEKTTEAVLKTLGIKTDFVRGSIGDIVAAVKDNRVAGYVKSGVGGKLDGSSLDIANSTPISVVSLTDAQAKKIKANMPDVSIVNVPAGAAEGIPAYTTWSFGVGVVAPSDLDEETAYQISKAVMSDKTVQASAMAALKGVDIADITLKYSTIKLHPGTIRYLEEAGHKVPAHLK